MGIFYNSTEEPPSKVQIMGMVMYVMLSSVSIWATAESIITSFGFPPFISYIIGTGIVGGIAMMLTIVKKSVKDKNTGWLIFGFTVFLIAWGASLLTNTHKFFTQMKLDEIRQHELDVASNELINLRTNSHTLSDLIINGYSTKVSSRIDNYVREVKNVKNCGHGPVADSLRLRVEEVMDGLTFELPSGYGRTGKGCNELGNYMNGIMKAELKRRKQKLERESLNMDACHDPEQSDGIEETLDYAITFYFSLDPLDVKKVLARAHKYYNKVFDCVEERLTANIHLVDNVKLDLELALVMPAPSIRLEKITELLPFVRKNKDYRSSLIYSGVAAFIIDLMAIGILYFLIMGKHD